uniref:Prospero domain-containing protein n=1 Tax=Macrostomum lignano TaxID=282301 RepID=A0A1I8JQ46_9PLAT
NTLYSNHSTPTHSTPPFSDGGPGLVPRGNLHPGGPGLPLSHDPRPTLAANLTRDPRQPTQSSQVTQPTMAIEDSLLALQGRQPEASDIGPDGQQITEPATEGLEPQQPQQPPQQVEFASPVETEEPREESSRRSSRRSSARRDCLEAIGPDLNVHSRSLSQSPESPPQDVVAMNRGVRAQTPDAGRAFEALGALQQLQTQLRDRSCGLRRPRNRRRQSSSSCRPPRSGQAILEAKLEALKKELEEARAPPPPEEKKPDLLHHQTGSLSPPPPAMPAAAQTVVQLLMLVSVLTQAPTAEALTADEKQQLHSRMEGECGQLRPEKSALPSAKALSQRRHPLRLHADQQGARGLELADQPPLLQARPAQQRVAGFAQADNSAPGQGESAADACGAGDQRGQQAGAGLHQFLWERRPGRRRPDNRPGHKRVGQHVVASFHRTLSGNACRSGRVPDQIVQDLDTVQHNV